MQCPQCESKLVRSKYLGANVRECTNCNGILLDSVRAEKIQKRVDKNVAQLVKEAESSKTEDTVEKIRCPACRNRMDKELVKDFDFHVDECGNCDKVWFDGGELAQLQLAQLQLAFESKPQREEVNRMRERIKNMTDEERAEYEDRIANLKDLGTPMEQAVQGATAELAFRFWWYGGRRF